MKRSQTSTKKTKKTAPTALLLVIVLLLLAATIVLYQMKPTRISDQTSLSQDSNIQTEIQDFTINENLEYQESVETDSNVYSLGTNPSDPEITLVPEDPETAIENQPDTETDSDALNQSFNKREANLFFIKVNNDGLITLEKANRTVYFSNSPLTQTINALLLGPDTDELNSNFLTLIPENTQLLSARVSDRTAFLNFNETFRFNPLGIEGYAAQLQQIVYTATEFSNIDEIQFLIEGSKYDYLGAEGIYIGSPLSRSSFE